MAKLTLDELLKQIDDGDEKVRTSAWLRAGDVGAPAIKPLVGIMKESGNAEVARAAERAVWQIVRHAGRPEGDAERPQVTAELLALLAAASEPQLQRDLMWMVSEIAGDEAVEPVAARLKIAELREDARMVLERLPGKKATAALELALGTCDSDFRPAVADALRHRGVRIADAPSMRLVPTKKTELKPVGR